MFALPRFIKYTAIALLLSTTALTAPAFAAETSPVPKAHHHMHRMHHEWNMKEHMEKRIKTMHDSIRVTPDQESSWSDVAQVMRENKDKMVDIMKAGHGTMQSATAVDQLKSMQSITQAHADSMSKLIDVFEPFYDGLTSEQKQKADVFFKEFHHRGPGKHNGKHHGMPHKQHHDKAVAAPVVKVK